MGVGYHGAGNRIHIASQLPHPAPLPTLFCFPEFWLLWLLTSGASTPLSTDSNAALQEVSSDAHGGPSCESPVHLLVILLCVRGVNISEIQQHQG